MEHRAGAPRAHGAIGKHPAPRRVARGRPGLDGPGQSVPARARRQGAARWQAATAAAAGRPRLCTGRTREAGGTGRTTAAVGAWPWTRFLTQQAVGPTCVRLLKGRGPQAPGPTAHPTHRVRARRDLTRARTRARGPRYTTGTVLGTGPNTAPESSRGSRRCHGQTTAPGTSRTPGLRKRFGLAGSSVRPGPSRLLR